MDTNSKYVAGRMRDSDFTFESGEISQERLEEIRKSIKRGRRKENAKG